MEFLGSEHALAVFRVQPVEDKKKAAEISVGRITEDFLEARGIESDIARNIPIPDAALGCLDHQIEPVAASKQFLFGALLLGDVREHKDGALGVYGIDGPAVNPAPEPTAVFLAILFIEDMRI